MVTKISTWQRKGNLKSLVYKTAGILGFLIVGASFFGKDVGQAIAEKLAPSKENFGVSQMPYNFTAYTIEYQLGERTGGNVRAANGHSYVCCYSPEYPGQPIEIFWAYASGPYQGTPRGVYHYKAIVRQPVKSSDAEALTVRFYPGGRVAARYTARPETSDFGNVSPELTGDGWVEAHGIELPALNDKNKKSDLP